MGCTAPPSFSGGTPLDFKQETVLLDDGCGRFPLAHERKFLSSRLVDCPKVVPFVVYVGLCGSENQPRGILRNLCERRLCATRFLGGRVCCWALRDRVWCYFEKKKCVKGLCDLWICGKKRIKGNVGTRFWIEQLKNETLFFTSQMFLHFIYNANQSCVVC